MDEQGCRIVTVAFDIEDEYAALEVAEDIALLEGSEFGLIRFASRNWRASGSIVK